jgi:3-dehydroquinate synthase
MINSDLNFTFSKNISKNVNIYPTRNSKLKLIDILNSLKPDKTFIICDSNVSSIYGEALKNSISQEINTFLITHEPREVNKNLETISKISNEFDANNGTSRSVIVALGGGITGNIAGFFASTRFRGIPLIHIPTTLLAQVDSAVDVKQSVNSQTIKNSIGTYYAPDAVIIDVSYLSSLDDRSIRAGLGEALKHGIAQDMTLVEYILSCDKNNLNDLQNIISRTIKLKLEHWKNTPDIWQGKNNVERLTHLGHTTGKILEVIDLDYLTHGEAISHGMVIEAHISHILGYLDIESVNNIHRIMTEMGLLVPLNEKYTSENIAKRLFYGENVPIFALLQNLGNPNTISCSAPKDKVIKSLNWYLS